MIPESTPKTIDSITRRMTRVRSCRYITSHVWSNSARGAVTCWGYGNPALRRSTEHQHGSAVAVLVCRVTATNATCCFSNSSSNRTKSSKDRDRQDHHEHISHHQPPLPEQPVNNDYSDPYRMRSLGFLSIGYAVGLLAACVLIPCLAESGGDPVMGDRLADHGTDPTRMCTPDSR